jgi:hypothetical protein
MPGLELGALNEQLRNINARWQATEAPDEYHLGYDPGPNDHSLEEREGLALANHRQFMAMAAAAAAAPPYPPALDWRHLPAHAPLPAGNYVTPVKNQGSCGSCVAFGTCATFESAIRIHDKNPGKNVDLSEADLFYCHAEKEQGRTCNTGWFPDAALTVCQNVGVVDEACFPYTPGDQPCPKCNDWQHPGRDEAVDCATRSGGHLHLGIPGLLQLPHRRLPPCQRRAQRRSLHFLRWL